MVARQDIRKPATNCRPSCFSFSRPEPMEPGYS
jgi:hypothetical protein